MHLKFECEKLKFENRVSHTRFLSVFLNGKIESIRLELLEMQIVWKVAQLIILFRIYSYFFLNNPKLAQKPSENYICIETCKHMQVRHYSKLRYYNFKFNF